MTFGIGPTPFRMCSERDAFVNDLDAQEVEEDAMLFRGEEQRAFESRLDRLTRRESLTLGFKANAHRWFSPEPWLVTSRGPEWFRFTR